MLYHWKGILTKNSAPLEPRKSDQWKWRKGRIMRGMVNAGGEDRTEGSVHLDLSSSTPRDVLRVGWMASNCLGMRGLSLTLVIIHQ